MSPKRIGPLAYAWYRWKALRLPWRRRFFVGCDLEGNTFWEFRLTTRGAQDYSPDGERWRRIVSYPRSTHYSQVKVSPMWHQWLRYTREDPPSLAEQQGDVTRQERMKHLAAEADARWEAKPRVMEDAAPSPQLEQANASAAQPDSTQPNEGKHKKQEPEDPWAKARPQGPGEKWQPEAWNPTAGASKRS